MGGTVTDGAVVECVPNFSEGLDEKKVRAIVAAMATEGVSLLDWSRDPDHNRSVVTIAGHPVAVVESALRGVGKAAELIDLSTQQGVHPRIGAADVVPFVPVAGIWLASRFGGATAFRSIFTKPPPPVPIAHCSKTCAEASSRDSETRSSVRRRAVPTLADPACIPPPALPQSARGVFSLPTTSFSIQGTSPPHAPSRARFVLPAEASPESKQWASSPRGRPRFR